ncbi:single-stranded DNA-binding protein [Kribbella qitaiheensis]|uniref:Single-stranded DNA-binding protein n=1 Tax=Kribbella qitaiheensis TaxID=1544730 RepID=A0A7G6WVZ0_9ACTN|nr:single-stranded DNA-binding protein [Kribbella qitaiheensis]QNE18155.1 single-stranded DNA-binding protein [Kribbella qitaiheensis]
MSNPVNQGTLIGRLARDPMRFKNSDGSHKVVFTVFADRDHKNARGEVLSDAISVEAFVRKETDVDDTPFAKIHRGDKVALSTTLRMDNYVRDGENIYDLKVVVERITFLESLQVTQARLAERVVAAEQTNQAARAATPAQAEALVGAQNSPIGSELPFS